MKYILNKIYDFCKVKENVSEGIWYEDVICDNIESNRFKYILNLLKELSIPFEIDEYFEKKYNITYRNIILRGNSDTIFTAHYDVLNPHVDNANDNSASVINLIALKKLNPDVNVVLLDAEERPFKGKGSKILSERLNQGLLFTGIKWILNLELTGLGGKNIITSTYKNNLSKILLEKFNAKSYNMPLCDSYVFNQNNVESEVITCVPKINGIDDFTHLRQCHTIYDSIDKISIDDMAEFVNEILLPISKF